MMGGPRQSIGEQSISRQSLGVSKAAQQGPKRPRQSLAGRRQGRISGIGGKPPATSASRRKSTDEAAPVSSKIATKPASKKDPPTRDGGVVRAINKFLEAKRDHPLFPAKKTGDKKRGRPQFPEKKSDFPMLSMKDGIKYDHYQDVANFLFKLIDPNFSGFSPSSFYAEFPIAMGLIGYPYAVHQSDFQTFGVRQRLSAVLDPLYWLSQVLSISGETAEPISEALPGEQEQTDEIEYYLLLFHFFRNAYSTWLREGDQYVEDFEKDMQRLCTRDSEHVLLVHDQLISELKEKRKQLKSLEQLDDQRSELHGEIGDAQKKVQERAIELRDLQSHLEDSVANIGKIKKDIELQQSALDECQRELKKAKTELEQKRIDTDQMNSVLCQIEKLQNQIKAQDKQTQSLKQGQVQADQESQDEINAMMELAGDMNESLKALNIPRTITINPKGATAEQVLGVKVEALVQSMDERRRAMVDGEKEKKRIKKEKADLASEMKALDLEATDLGSELKSLAGPNGRDLTQMKRKYDGFIDQAKRKQDELRQQTKEADEKAHGLVQYFRRYREHVEKTLQEVVAEAGLLTDAIE
jgi:SMC interacting uncharacterized protein involved in chromosome segregation